MSHARVEELSDSDSDPDIDDPTSYLPQSDPSIISRADIPLPGSSTTSTTLRSQLSPPSSSSPHPPPIQSASQSSLPPSVNFDTRPQQQSRASIKSYISIYPLYFDISRSRHLGRRVPKSLAIANPLAYNIAHALPQILAPNQLQMAFEPDKCHPKDWANPGRVRVEFFSSSKDKDGSAEHSPLHPKYKSKSHLFLALATYLSRFPTTESDVLRLKIPGLPVPDGGYKKPEVPRGWRVNELVPLHSNAVSGGGVSDNFFKEAMEELKLAQQAQGQGGGGQAGVEDGGRGQGQLTNGGGDGGTKGKKRRTA